MSGLKLTVKCQEAASHWSPEVQVTDLQRTEEFHGIVSLWSVRAKCGQAYVSWTDPWADSLGNKMKFRSNICNKLFQMNDNFLMCDSLNIYQNIFSFF